MNMSTTDPPTSYKTEISNMVSYLNSQVGTDNDYSRVSPYMQYGEDGNVIALDNKTFHYYANVIYRGKKFSGARIFLNKLINAPIQVPDEKLQIIERP